MIKFSEGRKGFLFTKIFNLDVIKLYYLLSVNRAYMSKFSLGNSYVSIKKIDGLKTISTSTTNKKFYVD